MKRICMIWGIGMLMLLCGCTFPNEYFEPNDTAIGTIIEETTGNITPTFTYNNDTSTLLPSDTESTIVSPSFDSTVTESPTVIPRPTTPALTPTPTELPTAEPTVTPVQPPVSTPTAVIDQVEQIVCDVGELTLYVGEEYTPLVTVMPTTVKNKDYIMESNNSTVATIKEGRIIGARGKGECTVKVSSAENNGVIFEIKVIVLHTPSDKITYIDGILIANKTYALPQSHDPGDLTEEFKQAFNAMAEAAEKEGLELYVVSGYRSYSRQKTIYERYVERDGKEEADTYSARPGHSEHQSGLAADICSVSNSFAHTPEGKWLAAHCHEFGFIIRYPEGKQEITGYIYEPWHIRYLGVDIATAVFESGLCLEEYLGITSVYE